MITEKQAVDLAVRYNAFHEAMALPQDDPRRRQSVYVWATSLNETQKQTGIVLMSMLDDIIASNLPVALRSNVDA